MIAQSRFNIKAVIFCKFFSFSLGNTHTLSVSVVNLECGYVHFQILVLFLPVTTFVICLTVKAPITTAADDKFVTSFLFSNETRNAISVRRLS